MAHRIEGSNLVTTFLQPPAIDVHVTGRRVVSTLIDLFMLGVVFRILTASLDVSSGFSVEPDGVNGAAHRDFASRLADNAPDNLIYFGTYIGIAALYYIVLEGAWGRTIGKWATGIRVVSATGGKLGLGSVIARTAFRLIDGFGTYFVGFLVAITSSRRQRLGDMVASTLVVRA